MIDLNTPVSEIIDESIAHTIFIKPDEKLWVIGSFLTPYMGNYTDSGVVADGNLVYGVFGGRELLWKINQNPNWGFFKNTSVKDITLRKIKPISPETNLYDMLEEWDKSKFYYSLIKTRDGFKSVFSKNMIKYLAENNIQGKLKDIPRKPLVTFSTDDTVEYVIKTMIESKCRRLVLDGTQKIIDDRIILDKVINDCNFLKNTDNFLNQSAEIFATKEILEYPSDLSLESVCSIMLKQNNPCVFSEGKIVTQFDMIEYARKSHH